MLTRRSFFRITGASTVGWFVATKAGWVQRAMAQIPGGSLDPGVIAKFATPLLDPSGHAARRNDHPAGREAGRLLQDLGAPVRPADPARRNADDEGVGVRGGEVCKQNGCQSRFLICKQNGCQSRFLILDFSGIPGIDVWQIGNQGGFLAAPVHLTADHNNQLLMGPAERTDLIVDFTQVATGDHVIGNLGPDEPFGGGEPDKDFDTADPDSTGQIMQFHVVPALAADPTTPPAFLKLPSIIRFTGGATRSLAMLEKMSAFFDEDNEMMRPYRIGPIQPGQPGR